MKTKFLLVLLSLLNFVNASTEPDLFVVESNKIFRIGTSTNASDLKTSVAENFNGPITDADYHFSRNLIFWIDANSRQILCRNLDPTSPTGIRLIVDHPGAWEPSALAVDHVNDKIYVVDTLGRKVDAWNLDGERRVIVAAEDLERPTGIALDPYAGLMFVVDSDRIVRMNMDGSAIRSVIQKAIEFSITAIALDTVAKTVYWWDSDLNSIESSSYIGESRRVLHHHGTQSSSEQIASLAFFDRHLYYADRASGSVWKIDTNANTPKREVEKVLENVNATSIRVVHSSVQRSVDQSNKPCENSDCEYACLPSSANTDRACRCGPGQLLFGKSSCMSARELLLYSQKEVVKARESYPGSGNGVVLSIAKERGQSLSLDFDYARGLIYFSDAYSKRIYRSNVTSGKMEEITSYEGSARIAVDWAAKNLYYTDYVEGTLNVVSLKNNKYKKVLLDNLVGPKDIAVHPRRAQIFFYDDGRIKRVNTDGKKLATIHEPILHKSLRLALDIVEERLYWAINDLEEISSNSTIQHASLNGTDVRALSVRYLRDCSSLAVHGDWIYVVAENYERLLRIDKRTGKGELMPRDRQGFYALAVYSPDRQASWKEEHPCAKNNGKCEKLCYAVPWTKNRQKSRNRSLMHVCDCPSGERLARDRRSCKNASKIKEKQLVHRCEPDWEYTCRNGRCIPRTQICDGINDCLDRSDENNCPAYNNFFHDSR